MEAKHKLLDDSSDSDVGFQVNESYAKSYEKWRHGEELQKLKAKYGSDGDISSSSSESEDEDPPVIEKDFLKALSLLKSKDPQIYDGSTEFFKEDHKQKKEPKVKKPKPLYPKDYEREQLLGKNGKWSDEDEDVVPCDLQPTYDEEQKELKAGFRAALEDSEDDDDDSLLQIREKDEAKKKQDEADYIQWLKGEKEDLSDDKSNSDLKFLRKYWNDPNLDSGEQFLKDYILSKKYAVEDDDGTIPTYEEITNDIGDLSDDEQLLEEQEAFEHKYNFRFEEPDSEFIKKYPRTIGDSLRKKDNKRKLKREEYQERKQREKEQKKEEIKRLKALKRKEIEDKLSKLREITGNEKLGFDDYDVEGDFDPNEHDKKMSELFNNEYYDVEETDKPQLPSDEELDVENWDNWTGSTADCGAVDGYYEGPHCEDHDFNMDADYDPKMKFQMEMIESSKSTKKGKQKKSKFAAAVSKEKPVFDPSLEPFEKYFDEYYKLDYEDIINDLPVRFKYHKVVPNDFGLTTDEILAAKEKELNRWCSLKKTCQYRREDEEVYDVQAFRKKAENEALKKKVFLSLHGEQEQCDGTGNGEAPVESKKRRRRKKNKKLNVQTEEAVSVKNDDVEKQSVKQPETLTSKRSKSRDSSPGEETTDTGFSEKNCEAVRQGHDFAGTLKKCKKRKSGGINICQGDQVMQVEEQMPDEQSMPNNIRSNGTVDRENKRDSVGSGKKRKRKREANTALLSDVVPVKQEQYNSLSAAKKSRKFKASECTDKRLQISDARLKAFGINPKKFKNRVKYSQKNKNACK